MTSSGAFWTGWVLLFAALPPLCVGRIGYFGDALLAFAGASVLLGAVAFDHAVGRAWHPVRGPWRDRLLVTYVIGWLATLWGAFWVYDLGQAQFSRVLFAVVGGAALFPAVLWLGEGRRAGPFWACIALLSAMLSHELVERWRYPWSGLGLWVTVALIAAFTAVVLVWRLARGPRLREGWRAPVGPVLAGALIGLAHVNSWTVLRAESLHTSASFAMMATWMLTTLVLYALGPVTLSRLLARD